MNVADWNAEEDFTRVLDALEPVRVVREGCDQVIDYPRAWRFVESEAPIGERADAVLRSDAIWHLPAIAGEREPMVGDRLIDGAGACWTLRRVKRLRAATRFVCEARSTRLCSAQACWVRLDGPVWQTGVEGPEIVDWQPDRLAVSAVIEVLAADIPAEDPSAARERVRITFAERITAGPQQRVVTPRGEVYQLIDAVSDPAPGTLPSVTALSVVTV
ncbi:hypothetical protein [Botrimarina hoheduenensis]|uniref:Uncharacterized protein n=1 Tax=Botrimarina hoheduenensis TaxID=2528000 RepID=A0A5C5W8Y0_9BACT|nr:hypothetical protein [Botrimarina hoheduenensis]TWT46489.1 hypothetical protein Pla111_15850 [Botrimarina hoheduenensis]